MRPTFVGFAVLLGACAAHSGDAVNAVDASGPSDASNGGTGGSGSIDLATMIDATAGGMLDAGGAGLPPCPASVLPAGDTNQSVRVGSTTRSFVLHVPSMYTGTARVPLVVDFHPLGGSGPGERAGSPYPAVTDPEGVIMAFPSGLAGPAGNAWNVGACCVDNADDVAFAKALVAQVETTACIDPKRVYAVGFSMGGGMSHYLACHAADVFAAVAPAAFDLLKENSGDCAPSRPISVISFRSTGDPIVPYAGGYSMLVPGHPINFLGAAATFQKWAAIEQCTGSPSAPDSQGCSTYSSCSGGVEVTLCTKRGGGHDPGNATVAWPVLKRHPMP